MIKKILLLLPVLLLAVMPVACSDDGPDSDFENVANFNDLPKEAQTFLTTYFSTYTMSYITRSGGEYEVTFANGTEVDFNSAGQWTDIDAGVGTFVPFEVIPLGVSNYINVNYPAQNVTEIARTLMGGYVVELTNDIELAFDSNGNFVGYD